MTCLRTSAEACLTVGIKNSHLVLSPCVERRVQNEPNHLIRNGAQEPIDPRRKFREDKDMENMPNGDEAVTNSLLKQLGVEPVFSDEEGPEVDKEKLRRFARRELGPYASKEIEAYVASFRAWFRAFAEVLAEAEFTQGFMERSEERRVGKECR